MAKEWTTHRATLEMEPTGYADLPYLARLQSEETGRSWEAAFTLDLAELKDLFHQDDPAPYGRTLFQQVFVNSQNEDNGKRGVLAARLHELLRGAEDANAAALRLRLEISRSLPQLHAVAWEAMLDEEDGRPMTIAADRRLTLYRDIAVSALRKPPIEVRPRILATAVCPSKTSLEHLSQRTNINLELIDVPREMERIQGLLSTVRPQWLYQMLPPLPESGQSKLDQIVEAMAEGEFHVLHLLCHGLVMAGQPYLIFAKDDGTTDRVKAADFAQAFADLSHVRLIVFEACQTAQLAQDEAFAGVVQELIKVMPASVGMQRNWYTGEAGDRFVRTFYRALAQEGPRSGFVDLALQQARAGLRRWRPDGWEWSTPVLYLRLLDGRLFRIDQDTEKPAEKPAEQPTGRSGGAGLVIGPGAKLKGVTFDGQFAAKDIIEGGADAGDGGGQAGVGAEIGQDVELEDVRVSGQYAGGSIRKALAEQANESYGPAEQAAALRGLQEYYRQQLDAIATELAAASGERERQLRAELADAQSAASSLEDSMHVDRVAIRDALVDSFSASEIEDLCFELGIDHEEIPGNTKSAKARELVRYAERWSRTADLVEAIARARPNALTGA